MSTGSAMLKPVAGNQAQYELTGSVDFATVPGLLRQGYDWLDNNSEVQINLSGVTHCNSAALGLLLEWLRQARLRKTTLHFHAIPEALLQIAHASEVESLLTT